VRARRPGDRIRPRPDAPSRSIKQLFQLSGTPPWLRDGVPVLCLGDEPVGLGDWIIDESLAQLPGAGSFRLAWHPADPGLAAARAIAHQTTVDRTNTVS
jgi:tRNA(Ile)-lysidine synthase